MRNIKKVRVCVLGGAGFLGSHLVDHLIEDRECEVLVIDNLVAGRREFVHSKAKFVHHDITGSEEYLKTLFVNHKIEYAFNYIANPYVPDSFDRPLRVSDVNYMGAIKVINASQEAGCKGILQVSSAEIYGEGARVGSGTIEEIKKWTEDGKRIDELDAVKPHSTYGAAKAAVDYFCQCAWRERATPVIALRQFNCVGARETHPYIVPEIIGQLQLWDRDYGKKYGQVHLGNNSFRDFLAATDAVAMAVELLEKGSFGEVYNLGSETGIKMYDLAELIGKQMGFEEIKVAPDKGRMRPWEIWHLQSSNEKIYNVIKRRPLNGLAHAIGAAIEWYFDNECVWPWEK